MNPSEPTQTPQAAPADAAPVSERERIYQQFYVAPPASPEPAATPVDAAAPPQANDAQPDATPPPLTQEQILASLVDKIGQLEQRLAAPAPAPPVQAASPQAAAKLDWLDALAKGDREAGERALAARMAELNAERDTSLSQNVIAQVNAQREMEALTQQVRTQNADIAEMEPYVGARVQIRLNDAHARGQIQSPADYAKVYREALTDEVQQARNLYLRFRGAGAATATARTTQVVTTPALQPNAVNTQRDQPAQPSEPEVETPQAYLAKRMARAAQGRGLGVA